MIDPSGPPGIPLGVTDAEASTRARLLEAAEACFAAGGFDGVGIRQIADAAGVNLSGIKYHFGSKRGLYLETIRHAMDRQGSTAAWAILDRATSSPEDAAGALREFVGAFLAVLLTSDDHACGACLVMQAALHPGESTDLVVDEFIRPHQDRLCDLCGRLRPDADGDQRRRAAHSIMALLLHQRLCRAFLDRLEHPADPRRPEVLARLADEITEFSLRGMGCGSLADRLRTIEGSSRTQGMDA
jgi:TetR/AcrR family transcriptional regulator, regulator of cefoperazone and chloramphenicol sensitivity